MRQTLDRFSEDTVRTVNTINHIKKLTKQALMPMVGRPNTKDEITRVMQNLLHSMISEKILNQYAVEVEENNDGPFMRIKESEKIADMVPGDQYGNSGLIIQRDDKGAVVFDPTITKKDDVWNIKVSMQPVQAINYISVQMEIKK